MKGSTATMADARESSTTRRFTVGPRVGAYAGVVAGVLLSFILGGALWGLVRPGYTATVVEDSQIELGTEVNVEFTAFFWYVLICALLGGAAAVIAYTRSPRTRGVGMLLWVTVWALIGAQCFMMVGEFITDLVHGIDDPDALGVGDVITYVPYFSSGIAADCVGGFWASIMYWALLVSGGDAAAFQESREPSREASVHEGTDEGDGASELELQGKPGA